MLTLDAENIASVQPTLPLGQGNIPRITRVLFIAPRYEVNAKPRVRFSLNFLWGNVTVKTVKAPQKIVRARIG